METFNVTTCVGALALVVGIIFGLLIFGLLIQVGRNNWATLFIDTHRTFYDSKLRGMGYTLASWQPTAVSSPAEVLWRLTLNGQPFAEHHGLGMCKMLTRLVGKPPKK